MIKIFQEYSMIMSERDSVHKEIEKLQDDVSNTNSKMKEVSAKNITNIPIIPFIVKVIIASPINQTPKLSIIVMTSSIMMVAKITVLAQIIISETIVGIQPQNITNITRDFKYPIHCQSHNRQPHQSNTKTINHCHQS